METAAFLGVLGLGYILSPDSKKKNKKEGFTTLDINYEQVGANPEKIIKKQKNKKKYTNRAPETSRSWQKVSGHCFRLAVPPSGTSLPNQVIGSEAGASGRDPDEWH